MVDISVIFIDSRTVKLCFPVSKSLFHLKENPQKRKIHFMGLLDPDKPILLTWGGEGDEPDFRKG